MKDISSKEKLEQASALLDMLEALMEGLEEKGTSTAIPWKGIRLSLSQGRNLIASAASGLRDADYCTDPDALDAEVALEPMKRSLGSLSGRIHRMPRNGSSRVRELVANTAGERFS